MWAGRTCCARTYRCPRRARTNECADGDRCNSHHPHALGESEIPANPQRIAVVGYNEVEELLALGITPIAKLYETPAHFPPEAAQIPLIGNEAGQANLEKLLELKPDLIVGPDWALTEQYDLLTQIAPTVVVPRGSFAEWQEALRFTADLVGRTAQAEELLAAYEQRVTEVRDAIVVLQFRPL